MTILLKRNQQRHTNMNKTKKGEMRKRKRMWTLGCSHMFFVFHNEAWVGVKVVCPSPGPFVYCVALLNVNR